MYRKQTVDCQRGGSSRDQVKKVKGLRSTNWWLQNSHGNVGYGMENTVKNIVITMYGARWVLEILVVTFYKVYHCLATMVYT